jgi:hypothetical protein
MSIFLLVYVLVCLCVYVCLTVRVCRCLCLCLSISESLKIPGMTKSDFSCLCQSFKKISMFILEYVYFSVFLLTRCLHLCSFFLCLHLFKVHLHLCLFFVCLCLCLNMSLRLSLVGKFPFWQSTLPPSKLL